MLVKKREKEGKKTERADWMIEDEDEKKKKNLLIGTLFLSFVYLHIYYIDVTLKNKTSLRSRGDV